MYRYGPPNCPICVGGQCRGGGNLQCVQRDPRPSHIAGILDGYGGVRVVVAHKSTFKHHLRCGEFLCIVPNKLVHEPIAWGDLPFVIRLGEIAVEEFTAKNAMSNDPDARDATRWWKSRKTWFHQGSLNLLDIVYT